MKILILTLLTTAFAQADINDHFSCWSARFFNRLQIEVEQQKEITKVTLQSFDANRAARALGIGDDNSRVDTLELSLPNDWCRFSKDLLAVFACNIPDAWPPKNIEVTARDNQGAVVGSTTLSHLDLRIDHTVRTSAGFDTDWVSHNLDLHVYMISEKDNAKRATLGLPYEVSNCEKK